MEVGLADDPGGSGAKEPARNNPTSRQKKRFEKEQAHHLRVAASESFHQGKVAATLQYARRQGREDADTDGEGDEKDCTKHQSVRLVHDGRFTIHKLPNRLNIGTWKNLPKARNSSFNPRSTPGDLHLSDCRRDARPRD